LSSIFLNFFKKFFSLFCAGSAAAQIAQPWACGHQLAAIPGVVPIFVPVLYNNSAIKCSTKFFIFSGFTRFVHFILSYETFCGFFAFNILT